MAIADGDLSIAANGDIRWTGDGSTTYTVLELHRWLQDKADDAVASGDDLLDITDTTPSERSTDNIITLNSPYNIDDATAQHFYDGSITQSNGDVRYSGLVVVGAVDANEDTPLAAAIADDGGALTDETSAAAEATANDMTLLPAAPAVNDAYYFGADDPFQSLQLNISTAGSGTWTVTWEYWDGSAWSALVGVTDGTTGFTVSGEQTVSFTQPLDWATTSVNAQGPFYYVRARVSAFTSITTQPLGQSSDVTKGTILQIVQNNTLLTNYWGPGINADAAANILLRLMVKTRNAGSDIDGSRLRVQARELGNTYAEFSLTAGLGNATAAIFTSADLNNTTAASTISGWASIANTEGYQGLDVTGDGADEFYYSQWDLGSQTVNDLYERTKWIQRRGTSETIHGINGELFRGITHEISYDTQDAAEFFTENEVVTFGNGATGLILADTEAGVDGGDTGKMYIQLLTGTAPANDDTIAGATCNALVNGTPIARTISPEFIGTSTGSAIIGAYGIGLQPADLTASDQLFDLDNVLRIPPNNVTFTVNGLIHDEDRVLVAPEDGNGAIELNQLTLNTNLTSATETQVVVSTAIPSDTPSSGNIRVLTDGGVYKRVAYSSYSGSTFTMDSGDPDYATFRDFSGDNATGAKNVFIAYIDELAQGTSVTTGNFVTGVQYEITTVGDTDFTLIGASSNTVGVRFTATGAGGGTTGVAVTVNTSASFTSVYSSNRSLFIRVRDGGTSPIRTFETTGTLGSAGGSATAIRTSDA